MEQRLQKLISQAGICSRRKAEELISQGRVEVNGQVAGLGDSADLEKDTVTLDGVEISPEAKVYFALNKPVGYESTLSSTTGKPTVVELIDSDSRIYPVGRLDTDSRGLLLLTNDGELAHLVMHPCSSLDKEYIVRVNGEVPDLLLQRMREGIELEEAMTWPCEVEIIERNSESTCLRFILHEGRKRQIRRMVSAIGFEVLDLKRIRVGNITLDGIEEGDFRIIKTHEIDLLRKLSSGDCQNQSI